MIKFKKIRYKNFLASGNQFIEIQLDTFSTTLICGKNGSSKSTFLDALTFSLFGKPYREINKPLLINSLNKRDCLTEIEFETNGKEYLIRRGIKPNIFEIYCDDVLVDQSAANRDYQDILEKTILKMNYKSFTQIVVLGSSTFVPFMKLKPAERRLVVEDILDIQIFSAMNAVLKTKFVENRDVSSALDRQIEILESKIELQKEHDAELLKRQGDYFSKLESEKDKLNKENENHLGVIKVTEDEKIVVDQTKLHALRKTWRDHVNMKSKLDDAYQKIQKEIKFYKNNSDCPTCKQSIDDKFKSETLNQKTEKLGKLYEASECIKKDITNVEKFVVVIEEEIERGRCQDDLISEYRRYIQLNQRRIDSIENELKSVPEDSVDNSALGGFQIEQEKIKNELIVLQQEKARFEILESLLKDSGIKSRIIKQYLPLINKTINQYLIEMDFYVNFTLDENFNEIVLSNNKADFSFGSFSEGEKARINLAILLTWRTIARLRNSVNTNLLLLDEIFDSSLDGDGTEELFSILQVLSKDTNVFVISHRESMLDKFENVMKFSIKNGFSSYE